MIPETNSFTCRRCRHVVHRDARSTTLHSFRWHLPVAWTLAEANWRAALFLALLLVYIAGHAGAPGYVLVGVGLVWSYGTYWWAVLNLNSRGFSHKERP